MDKPREIRSDFKQREVVFTPDLPRSPSALPGVERRMLDRVGDEVARATSVVRYEPGSQFSPHTRDEFRARSGLMEAE